MSFLVLGSEYYSDSRIYYDGGQVVNVTLTDGRYVWDYWNGEEFKVGNTAYKVDIGDSIIIYNVFDPINIPSLYSPRIWRETIHNDQIIETSEYHTPLYLLLIVYSASTIVLLRGVYLYKKGKK